MKKKITNIQLTEFLLMNLSSVRLEICHSLSPYCYQRKIPEKLIVSKQNVVSVTINNSFLSLLVTLS